MTYVVFLKESATALNECKLFCEEAIPDTNYVRIGQPIWEWVPEMTGIRGRKKKEVVELEHEQ